MRFQTLKEREQAYDVDPYFAILLDLEPYWEATLSGSKGFGLATTVEWYRRNEWWWRPVKDADPAFRAYYETQYGPGRS